MHPCPSYHEPAWRYPIRVVIEIFNREVDLLPDHDVQNGQVHMNDYKVQIYRLNRLVGALRQELARPVTDRRRPLRPLLATSLYG